MTTDAKLRTAARHGRVRDAAEEPYRQSALHLWRVLRERPVPAVVVASATAGEGTTTCAIQIARQFRDALGLRPLLVRFESRSAPLNGRTDQDLHGLQDLLALSNGQNLAGCVQKGEFSIPTVVRSRTTSAPNMTARLQAAIARVLRERQPEYSVVIIDAPPLLESTDTMAICEVVPQVVLVVAAGQTRYEVLERVTSDLQEHKVSILGTILNKQERIIPNWFYRAFFR